MLRRLNLTLKKKHCTLRKKELKKYNSNGNEFWETVKTILAKDLIFLDESGVNLAKVRLFARSPQGQRAYSERPHKRGQNVSIIGAMSLNGVIAQCSLMGGTDAVTSGSVYLSKVSSNYCGEELV